MSSHLTITIDTGSPWFASAMVARLLGYRRLSRWLAKRAVVKRWS